MQTIIFYTVPAFVTEVVRTDTTMQETELLQQHITCTKPLTLSTTLD